MCGLLSEASTLPAHFSKETPFPRYSDNLSPEPAHSFLCPARVTSADHQLCMSRAGKAGPLGLSPTGVL